MLNSKMIPQNQYEKDKQPNRKIIKRDEGSRSDPLYWFDPLTDLDSEFGKTLL